MTTLYFKCKLLSDVILNQKAASDGPNTTLDFIPGSNFLGIVASTVYTDDAVSDTAKWEIFHSGKVRFGDAHPSVINCRGLRIPAAVFYPKMENITEHAYIHHCIANPADEEFRKMQLKQCRTGFYAFDGGEAMKIVTSNNYAIKSSYDKVNRKSEDEKIFGYQSLAAGLEMRFSIEIDNDSLVEIIRTAIKGKKKVGRSRCAQYGLVEIMECADVPAKYGTMPKSNIITVYADGRLIFLDDNGTPTLQPAVQQLGFANGTILWHQCQIRTFCYAPYNYKRRCFDTDRCGIEKGSVFVVKTDSDIPAASYIGSYNNEGFGAVIYNPYFLAADSDGLSVVKYMKENLGNNECCSSVEPATELVNFLKRKLNEDTIESEVYPQVLQWVKNNKGRFDDGVFASQWGHIRSLAMTAKTQAALKRDIEDYLGHGVAKDKWEERNCNRKNSLMLFIDTLNDDNASITIVNLAAEMVKECRKETKL